MFSIQKDETARLQKAIGGIASQGKRNIAFLTLLTKVMKERGFNSPVVVGGTAVEIYTYGRFASIDLDIVCNRDNLLQCLADLGLTHYPHDERIWFLDGPDSLVVDYQGGNLTYPHVPSDPFKRVRVFAMADGEIAIAGKEDLIVDRLMAYSTGDSDSEYQARALIETGNIDNGLLDRLAEAEDVKPYLDEIRAGIQREQKK